MSRPERVRTFAEFYPFYLSEHANRTSRRLHVIGTSIALVLLVATLLTQYWWLIAAALSQGYGLAWLGHFAFEHNQPAAEASTVRLARDRRERIASAAAAFRERCTTGGRAVSKASKEAPVQ